jgi:hypothetical protein
MKDILSVMFSNLHLSSLFHVLYTHEAVRISWEFDMFRYSVLSLKQGDFCFK